MPPLAGSPKLQDRYELRETLGRGGMGVVYRAYDTLMKREVALKTILDIENSAALELFYRECSIQASIVHPNIVEIYDIGDFEDQGVRKPFFVMPLLPGVSLDQLIKEGSPRLTVKRALDIIVQACRGLQAAHDRGLIHRDLKPGNIFVMPDDSVKLIDFGIAHITETGNKTSLKGTLAYMAPEQLQMKPPTAVSDIFSLGVVCYETLTRRKPFQGGTESELSAAIIYQNPPSASEINNSVSEAVSQVVHKALAKQPWHRVQAAKDFGELLQKAGNDQPLELFDSTKIKPRIERVNKAFESGDYNFATEILTELEGEGHLDQEITLLRRRLDQAMKQTKIQQLVVAARRFFDEEEFPLALRKLQEALDLDPNDAGTLTLKSQIEKIRREKQIGEWYELADRHLENNAFSKAREAVDNVLALKPNETQALTLQAEIDRREEEIKRDREEKSQLYQSAMNAWEKGDVTHALGRLENLLSLDRQRPENETGRTATYQKFYNQVRSERDAIENGYDGAREKLANEEFEEALAVCTQFLAKYPNHALFQALKFDVEEAKRQKLSAVIAETDRRVDSEPDLDKRVAIIDEALGQYPGEPHFERAKRLVQDKRDLVSSIVSKGRYFEENDQFNEALDQWLILRTIHAEYPGLDFEVERLEKRRAEQSQTQAKTRWVAQIDGYLEAGDHGRALDVCRTAIEEFPQDQELKELQKLAEKQSLLAAEAMALVDEGKQKIEAEQYDEGLKLLREARARDERSGVVRTVLLNSLLERARRLVDSDYEAADSLVDEILEIDPSQVAAQGIRKQAEARKKEEFVSWAAGQARRLQTEGDVAGARAVAEQGLESYPEEPRLKQLMGTLSRAQGESKGSGDRLQALETLRSLELRIGEGLDARSRSSYRDRVRAIAERHGADDEVARLATTLTNRLDAEDADAPYFDETKVRREADDQEQPTELTLEGEPADGAIASPPPALESAATPGSQVQQNALSKTPKPSSSGAKKGAKSWLSTQLATLGGGDSKPAQPRKSGRKPMPLFIAGGAVLALVAMVAGWAAVRLLKERGASGGPLVAVSLQSAPSGAEIFIDGERCGSGSCEKELRIGPHEARAQLVGYRAAVLSFDVSAPGAEQTENPGPLTLLLEPLAATLQLSSDLGGGEVKLDGDVVGSLDDGEFTLEGIKPGPHRAEISYQGAKANIEFEVIPGQPPVIFGPVETQNLRIAAVTALANRGRVYGGSESLVVALNDQMVGVAEADGLVLPALPEGANEVAIGEGSTRANLVFYTYPEPTLTAFLKSDRNVGGLRINTAEDDVTVYLNGEKYRRSTSRGRMLVYLYPKEYKVRIEKEGFITPPEQTVAVVKGEQAQLEFELEPEPQTANLSIKEGVPGSDVLINGRSIGTIGPDGRFRRSGLAPGPHKILLRRDLYEPKEFTQNFVAGETIEIDGSLANAMATLRIQVSPADVAATLTLQREGESQPRQITDKSFTLPQGTYTVRATAAGYKEFAATVRLDPNETKTANLTLQKIEQKREVGKPTDIRSIWAEQGEWTRHDALLVKKGGEFVLSPIDPQQGSYWFTAILQRGRRLEWVVDYKDDQNYILFQIDKNDFNRIEVVEGRRQDPITIPHEIDQKSFINVQVDIASDSIVTRLYRSNQWVELDGWIRPGARFDLGKFGFYIHSRDQIALSHFTFTPGR